MTWLKLSKLFFKSFISWIAANENRGEFSVKALKIFINVGGADVCLIKIGSLKEQMPYECEDCFSHACLPNGDQKPEHGTYCWVVGNPHNAFAELGVNIFRKILKE